MMKKDTKNKSLKNKLKLFAVTALAFTAISAAAIGVVGIEKAHAEEWKGGEIKQNYVFGETLKVPDYVLSVNGKELKTKLKSRTELITEAMRFVCRRRGNTA